MGTREHHPLPIPKAEMFQIPPWAKLLPPKASPGLTEVTTQKPSWSF